LIWVNTLIIEKKGEGEKEKEPGGLRVSISFRLRKNRIVVPSSIHRGEGGKKRRVWIDRCLLRCPGKPSGNREKGGRRHVSTARNQEAKVLSEGRKGKKKGKKKGRGIKPLNSALPPRVQRQKRGGKKKSPGTHRKAGDAKGARNRGEKRGKERKSRRVQGVHQQPRRKKQQLQSAHPPAR